MFYQPLLSFQHFSFLFRKRIKRFLTMEGGERGREEEREGQRQGERRGNKDKRRAKKRTSFGPNQTKFMYELYIFLFHVEKNQVIKKNKLTNLMLFISPEFTQTNSERI